MRPLFLTLLLRGRVPGGFAAAAGRLAGRLAALGLRPGDRAAILADRYDDSFTALFGAWFAGGVAVPLNVSLPAASRDDLLARLSPASHRSSCRRFA